MLNDLLWLRYRGLDGFHFIEAPQMPFFVGEFWLSVARTSSSPMAGYHTRAQHQDIHIVVFHSLVRRNKYRGTSRRGMPRICWRPRKRQCRFHKSARLDRRGHLARFADGFREIRVINGSGAIRSDVDNIVPKSRKNFASIFFNSNPAWIGPDGCFHSLALIYFSFVRAGWHPAADCKSAICIVPDLSD